MSSSFKSFITLVFQSILFWTLTFLLFGLVRFNGIGQELKIFFDIENDVPHSFWLESALILGLSIGVFYAIIESTFNRFIVKFGALGVQILLKTVIYFAFIIIALSFLSFYLEEQMDLDIPNEIGWWRTNPLFWTVVLYFIIASLIFSFLKIANEKFGKGVFLKLLLGNYRKPKEERRIFMFLDLKDSTTIAEQLGHKAYSAFIQDCFFDLNIILERYKAEVYQYVGDEAVLSWTFDKGINHNQCVKLFYGFKEQLKKRESYYLDNYSQFPEFKAGLHGGKLMVAEVGIVKKEIAYHGDVINTTARIQSKCNMYNSSLLISDVLLKRLRLHSPYHTKNLGQISLKGKQQEVGIYAIDVDFS